MTIKDMELQTGLARANIRYYEAEGLITPERAENGYRDYSQEDAETLLRVKLLRALGLTVGQIKAVVRGETELAAALSARIAAIQKEKTALDRAGEIAGRIRQAHAQFRTLDARPDLSVAVGPDPAGPGLQHAEKQQGRRAVSGAFDAWHDVPAGAAAAVPVRYNAG